MTETIERTAERAYTLVEAAVVKSVSVDTLRRAIKATSGPTLAAKKLGRDFRITASALDAWFDSLPDA